MAEKQVPERALREAIARELSSFLIEDGKRPEVVSIYVYFEHSSVTLRLTDEELDGIYGCKNEMFNNKKEKTEV